MKKLRASRTPWAISLAGEIRNFLDWPRTTPLADGYPLTPAYRTGKKTIQDGGNDDYYF